MLRFFFYSFLPLLYLLTNSLQFSAFSQDRGIHTSPISSISPEQYLWKDPTATGKPPIDFVAIEQWPSFGYKASISNDGSYFSYEINNQPYKSQTVIVQSTRNGWKKEWIGLEKLGVFSENSKWYIFQSGDSLYMQRLDSDKTEYIPGLISFKADNVNSPSLLAWQLKKSKQLILHNLSTAKKESFDSVIGYGFAGKGKWLVCHLQNKSLLLHDVQTGMQKKYKDVSNYQFGIDNKSLILTIKNKEGEGVQWVNLINNAVQTLLPVAQRKAAINNITVDKNRDQLLFMLQETRGEEQSNSYWYYNPMMSQARKILDNQTAGVDPGLFISGVPEFTDNGNYIRFNLMEHTIERKPTAGAAQVDVWHYQDKFLQSMQLASPTVQSYYQPGGYTAVVDINTGKLQVINKRGFSHVSVSIKGDHALITPFVGDDRFWITRKDSVWLQSLIDGKSYSLKNNEGNSFDFSPDGRYLINFDATDGHYHAYNIQRRQWVNISAHVPVYLGSECDFEPRHQNNNRLTGIAGWMANGEEILVYDKYDLWLLDLKGVNMPINITNGFGRKHGIVFRLTEGNYNNTQSGSLTHKISLLFTAFEIATKENGFYRKELNKAGNPDLLSKGPYVMDLHTSKLIPSYWPIAPAGTHIPIRARDADIWIIRKIAEQDGANYYVSTDLKNFRRLTNLQTHRPYNWYQTELIAFTSLDGKIGQGVLYKPENFNPKKKYPLLINYYRQKSQLLHEYKTPYYTVTGDLDIAWFVSRGYLVFTPDIYYTSRNNRPFGQIGAFNTVEGAAIYLGRLPYIDSLRMGIAGHSWAGGFTNYILTHSKRFAAVFTSAGVSDWVSEQLTLIRPKGPISGHIRGGADQQSPFLWEGKSKFKENPIMNVQNINSPLLIFHCKEDGAVPWEQGVELFAAMRQQEKPVWMLQYDRGAHDVGFDINDMRDFTVRVTQFFDHYLKGAPAPKWMTEGVPAHLKGIETGLELDLEGSCGKDCRTLSEPKTQNDHTKNSLMELFILFDAAVVHNLIMTVMALWDLAWL